MICWLQLSVEGRTSSCAGFRPAQCWPLVCAGLPVAGFGRFLVGGALVTGLALHWGTGTRGLPLP